MIGALAQIMGYSVRTKTWRYTEWRHWNVVEGTTIHAPTCKPDFTIAGLAAVELYSHAGDDGLGKKAFDDYENENEAHKEENDDVVSKLRKQLRAHFEPLQKGCPLRPGGSGLETGTSTPLKADDSHTSPKPADCPCVNWLAANCMSDPYNQVDKFIPAIVSAWEWHSSGACGSPGFDGSSVPVHISFLFRIRLIMASMQLSLSFALIFEQLLHLLGKEPRFPVWLYFSLLQCTDWHLGTQGRRTCQRCSVHGTCAWV